MNRQTRKAVDALWLQWGALNRPCSAEGHGLRARIALLLGKTATAAREARQAATCSRSETLEAYVKAYPPKQGDF